jgi:histidinol-phosphate aminotransferase
MWQVKRVVLPDSRGTRVWPMTPPQAGHPQVRPVIADIPAYVPGRPPVPREGVQTYKLSSNENPYPPLPGVLDAAVEAAATMNR